MPVFPFENWPADIYMIAGTTVDSGNGSITGVVTDLATRGIISDVEVVLMDADKNPITYVRSDGQGLFTFGSLAFGTYIVHAEIMGIHTVQSLITLSAEQPTASIGVQVNAGEANIVFSGVKEQILSLDKVGDIYPNPINNTAKVDVSIKKPVNLELSIYSQTGQLMNAGALQLSAGTQSIKLNTASLLPGLYLLRISTSEGEVVSRKFMKLL